MTDAISKGLSTHSQRLSLQSTQLRFIIKPPGVWLARKAKARTIRRRPNKWPNMWHSFVHPKHRTALFSLSSQGSFALSSILEKLVIPLWEGNNFWRIRSLIKLRYQYLQSSRYPDIAVPTRAPQLMGRESWVWMWSHLVTRSVTLGRT